MPGKGPSKNSSKDKFNKFQSGINQSQQWLSVE